MSRKGDRLHGSQRRQKFSGLSLSGRKRSHHTLRKYSDVHLWEWLYPNQNGCEGRIAYVFVSEVCKYQ